MAAQPANHAISYTNKLNLIEFFFWNSLKIPPTPSNLNPFLSWFRDFKQIFQLLEDEKTGCSRVTISNQIPMVAVYCARGKIVEISFFFHHFETARNMANVSIRKLICFIELFIIKYGVL